MEIDGSNNSFSLEMNESLRDNHHRPSLSSHCTHLSFGNTVLMVGVGRARLIYGTAGHKDIPEGLIFNDSTSPAMDQSGPGPSKSSPIQSE
jgi:hypothetical protein